MDHEATRDWIDEASVTPGVRAAGDATAAAARAHLAACAECRAYDVATHNALLKLDLARGPSPEVRTRVMAAARRMGAARREAAQPAPSLPWWRRPVAWRLAAAALVLAFVAAVGGAWWAQSGHPDNDADHLPQAVAMMSDMASEPGAEEVVLRTAAGTGGGIAVISPTSHRLAVFATSLSAGGYHCYVEHAGQRTWIGTMYMALGVQFWAGDMDPSVSMQPGDILVVATDPGQPAAVSATL